MGQSLVKLERTFLCHKPTSYASTTLCCSTHLNFGSRVKLNLTGLLYLVENYFSLRGHLGSGSIFWIVNHILKVSTSWRVRSRYKGLN